MILVSGASGTLGAEVVRALLRAGASVRALTRPGRRPDLPEEAEIAEGDLQDPASLTAALSGTEALFLLAGFDTKGILAQASRVGVGRVVLLSSGAVVGGEESNAVTRYNLDSEAAVRGSGVPWTILRPSGFMTNALRWVPQLKAGDIVRAPFGGVAVSKIDPADIASVVARTLTESGHLGASYRLTGPEPLLPGAEVAILAEVLGRNLQFESQPDDEARAEMSESMPADYVEAFFRYYVDGTYDDSHVDPTLPRLLGRAAGTFRQWADGHVDAFR